MVITYFYTTFVALKPIIKTSMRRLLFPLILLCTIISSCQQEKEERDLGFVQVIYCSPTNPTKCLPLEITQVDDGWEAKYIGAPTGGSIKIQPRLSINESGDTIWAFDEYHNGKVQGYYSFGGIKRQDNDIFKKMTYYNSRGEEKMTFHTCIVCKDDIFIEEENIPAAINSIGHHETIFDFRYSTDQRDINTTYLLHSNPNTISYQFKKDDILDTSTSQDQKLRTYRYISGGGMHPTSNYDISFLQYKAGNIVMTYDHFSSYLFSRLRKSSRKDVWPICDSLHVEQVPNQSDNFYLIEAIYSVYHDNGSYPIMDLNESVALFAFRVNKGKLTPVNILEGKSFIEFDDLSIFDHVHFEYNDKTKELKIPILDRNKRFTDMYRTIKVG